MGLSIFRFSSILFLLALTNSPWAFLRQIPQLVICCYVLKPASTLHLEEVPTEQCSDWVGLYFLVSFNFPIGAILKTICNNRETVSTSTREQYII
ncbi:hypothetical protein GLYMA_10G213300v4 [Glycine max]|nr:hypothetical protein GLYMA_10G213300v4 [Glycine max]KAH1139412.1 hypothetical protein GYH30_028694 [Glycine max]